MTITISGTINRELYFNLPWTKENPKYEIPMLESSPINTEIMTLQARDPAADGAIVTDYEAVPNDPNSIFGIITKSDSRGITHGQYIV